MNNQNSETHSTDTPRDILAAMRLSFSILGFAFFGTGFAVAQFDVEFSGNGSVQPNGAYVIERSEPFEFVAKNSGPTVNQDVTWSISAHASPPTSTDDAYFRFQEYDDLYDVASSFSGAYDPQILSSHPYQLIDVRAAGAHWKVSKDELDWVHTFAVMPIYLIDSATAALPDSVIDFGADPIHAEQEFATSISIPQNLLDLLNPSDFANGNITNWLQLRVVPIGRLWGQHDVEEFSANRYSPTRYLQAGNFEETMWIRYPGTYEFQLQSKSGIIFASNELRVLPAKPITSYRDDELDPARHHPGWWAEIVFPEGETINHGLEFPVEVHWQKIDPTAPDDEIDFASLYPTLEFFSAHSIPDACVSSNRSLHSSLYSLALEPDENGVLRGLVPAYFAANNNIWAALSVNGDRDQVDTVLRPFVGTPKLLRFEPPQWSGDVQVSFQKRREDLSIWRNGGEWVDYKITLSGVETDQFHEPPLVDLVYRPFETENGLRRGSGDWLKGLNNSEARWDREAGTLTAEFELSAYDMKSDIDILVRDSCGYGDIECFQSTYHRAPLPLPDQAEPPDWGEWLTYETADADQNTMWPAGPYNPFQICEAPNVEPFIGLANVELEIAALNEPVVALEMERIEVAVTNTGDVAFQNAELMIELGTRHPAERELANPASTVSAIILPSENDCEIDAQGKILTCKTPELEPDASFKQVFHVQAPYIGSILEIEAKIGDVSDAVDFVAAAPTIDAVALPAPPAEILKIIPISPQTGRDEFGEFATRYPYGTDPLIDVADQSRVLLVLGKNLPDRRVDAELISTDSTIGYHFLDSDQTFDRRELNYGDGGLLGSGLKRFFDSDENPTAMLAALEDRELEFVLVEANLAPKILPGVKSLNINGAQNDWVLDFANLSFDLQFMRLAVGDPSNQDPIIEDILAEAYLKENIRLVAFVSPQNIELPTMSAVVTLPEGPADQDNTMEIELVRQELNGGPAYVSAPISLGDAIDGGQSLFPTSHVDYYTRLAAKIDASYASAYLPRALGVEINLEMRRNPGHGSNENLFYAALEKAAMCKDIAIDRSDWRTKSFEEVAVLENTMVLNWMQSLEQNVHLGHLAGLILLRDSWVEITADQESQLERIISDPELLRRSYLSWRAIFDNPSLPAPVSPLFKLEVPAIGEAGASGVMMTFGQAVRFGPDIREQAENSGMSAEQSLAWVENVTRIAMQKMRNASIAARQEMLDEDPCDVSEMAEIGKGMQLVAELVAPKLVQFEDDTQRWQPDRQARMWLASAVDLADTYQDQVLAVGVENDFFLASASIALMPIAALEGAYVGYIAVGASVAEFSVQAVNDVSAYFESQEELERALGLSLVIGDRRYSEAKSRERTLGGLLANLALSSVSLGTDVLGFVHSRRVLRGADIAKNLDSLEAILALSGKRKSDFDAFYDDIIRIRATKSPDAISAEQRRIFDIVMGNLPPGRPPIRPGAVANPFPDSAVPPPTFILRSPEQSAAILAAGKSPEGINRFIPFHRSPNTPVRPLAYGGGAAEQDLLDGLVITLRKITNRYPENSIEHMLARQNLSALQEPSALIIFDRALSSPGMGTFDSVLGRYTLNFNVEAFLNRQVRGVKWHFGAIYVHEAGHMIQFTHEVLDGVTVGRALKEYDSTLRMSLAQNLIDEANGAARSLTPNLALETSLEYALETQWRSYNLADNLNPYFRNAEEYINGFTQFTHTEAVRRAQLFFPSLNEREIIEAYIKAQRRAYKAYFPVAAKNSLIHGADIGGKFSAMMRNAQARLKTLTDLAS